MNKLLLSILLLAIPFCFNCFAQSKQKLTTKNEVKETKLTSEQRVEKIAKYIVLTESEKSQILLVFKNAKIEKDKIKGGKHTKKVEKEKINAVKNIQKDNLKKILGAKRFYIYEKLKDKDIL